MQLLFLLLLSAQLLQPGDSVSTSICAQSSGRAALEGEKICAGRPIVTVTSANWGQFKTWGSIHECQYPKDPLTGKWPVCDTNDPAIFTPVLKNLCDFKTRCEFNPEELFRSDKRLSCYEEDYMYMQFDLVCYSPSEACQGTMLDFMWMRGAVVNEFSSRRCPDKSEASVKCLGNDRWSTVASQRIPCPETYVNKAVKSAVTSPSRSDVESYQETLSWLDQAFVNQSLALPMGSSLTRIPGVQSTVNFEQFYSFTWLMHLSPAAFKDTRLSRFPDSDNKRAKFIINDPSKFEIPDQSSAVFAFGENLTISAYHEFVDVQNLRSPIIYFKGSPVADGKVLPFLNKIEFFVEIHLLAPINPKTEQAVCVTWPFTVKDGLISYSETYFNDTCDTWKDERLFIFRCRCSQFGLFAIQVNPLPPPPTTEAATTPVPTTVAPTTSAVPTTSAAETITAANSTTAEIATTTMNSTGEPLITTTDPDSPNSGMVVSPNSSSKEHGGIVRVVDLTWIIYLASVAIAVLFNLFVACEGFVRSCKVLLARRRLASRATRSERLLAEKLPSPPPVVANYLEAYSLLMLFLPLACVFSLSAQVLLAASSFLRTTQEWCHVGQTVVFGLFTVQAALLLISALIDLGNCMCLGRLMLCAFLMSGSLAITSHFVLPVPSSTNMLCWPQLYDPGTCFLLVPLVFFIFAAVYLPRQIKHETSVDHKVAIWQYCIWLVAALLLPPGEVVLSLLAADWSTGTALLLLFTNTAVGSTTVAVALLAKHQMMRLQDLASPQYRSVELVDLEKTTSSGNKRASRISNLASSLSPVRSSYDAVDNDAADTTAGCGLTVAAEHTSNTSQISPEKSSKEPKDSKNQPKSVDIEVVDATDA